MYSWYEIQAARRPPLSLKYSTCFLKLGNAHFLVSATVSAEDGCMKGKYYNAILNKNKIFTVFLQKK